MPPTEGWAVSSYHWELHLRGLAIQERWRALCDAADARQDARTPVVARLPVPAPTAAPASEEAARAHQRDDV